MSILDTIKNIGKSFGNFLSSNASAIGSGVGGIGSTFISNATSKGAQARAYNYARLLQQQQYNLSIKGYKNAPSAQRKGLELAGFNPMLALGNVGNGVSIAGGTPVNANATDVSGAQNAISQAVQLKNQTEQTDALTDVQYADADLKKVQKAVEVQRLPYISKQAKADYIKTEMESAKLENDIHYQNEYLNYLEKSLDVQQRLGELGYKGTIYSADKAYNASTYSSDVASKSTPFRYFSDKFDKYVSKNGFKTPYELGYDFANRLLRH